MSRASNLKRKQKRKQLPPKPGPRFSFAEGDRVSTRMMLDYGARGLNKLHADDPHWKPL